MPGTAFIRGESVTVRTVEEDVEFLRDTINDPDVREGLTTAKPFNAHQEREYFEERISSDKTVNLLICEGDEPAGTVGLSDIDQISGTCEIGLWLAPEYHGRGYGTEASRLLTAYAFDELRMHCVQARVLADNAASHRIWEKLGFAEEGVHRGEAYHGSEHVDVHYYGMLDEEWDE